MAPRFRRIFLRGAIALSVAAGPIAVLDYFLPDRDVLRVVGTKVRRAGSDNKPINDQRPGATRDMFYVFAENIQTKKPHVLRNEDTGWGSSGPGDPSPVSVPPRSSPYSWPIQILSPMPI